MAVNRSYILAETREERLGIAMVNFFDLWREAHGINAIPDVRSCQEYIKDFLDKEVQSVSWGLIRKLRDERDLAADRMEHDVARDLMVASGGVEKKLKLEYL